MKKKRILVVEDEATVAFLIQESLSDLREDIEVKTTSTGEDALAQMERASWDLIVTDQRMPGMSGLELIENVKQKTPATLTILMTAYGSDELELAAHRLNVYHYMTKPFPLVDLKRVILDALALRDDPTAEPPPIAGEKDVHPAVKVTLGGAGSVGKSSLIRRLCTGEFDESRAMTIGVDFHLYDVQASAATTRLIVWDVSGQDHFAFTRRAFYRGSKAVGLVYDVSSRATFEQLETWRREVQELLPNVAIILVGNKTDLARQVSRAEGQALADRWGVPYFETSCANGEGVRRFFARLADQAVTALAAQHSLEAASLPR